MNLYAFYKRYLLLNLKDYPNIGIDFPITAVLFILALGLIATTIAVNIRRAKIAAVVMRLCRLDATSEDRAITISEMRLNTKSYRSLLSKTDGELATIVARVGAVKPTYEEYMSKKYKNDKIDFTQARFYISKEGSERAGRILDIGAPTVLNTILFSVLILAIFICLTFLMPGLMSILNDYLGGLNK